ncbi:hypothetical protein NCH01_13270 [Neoasaia chiangmaiensis]|nr:ABC transporter substrate-binding protein [Neoasaia chiangmaiensis]GEN14896.1 hypothetical protein NCH01_13270 [Neoasaia chiangmaiensis]
MADQIPKRRPFGIEHSQCSLRYQFKDHGMMQTSSLTKREKAASRKLTIRHASTALLMLAGLPVALMTAPATAIAQSSASDASAPIAALYNALQRIEAPGAGTSQARAQIVAPAIDQAFDLPTLLKNSVGMRYAALSPDEQQKLLAAFRQFTIAQYVSNFKPGAGAKFSIQPGSRPAPLGGGVIVDTKIGGASDDGTPIDYVMKPMAGGYRIVDVLLNAHISQVAAHRADFSSSLNKGGADALVGLLNRKTQNFMND